jgi:hypothetical protein
MLNQNSARFTLLWQSQVYNLFTWQQNFTRISACEMQGNSLWKLNMHFVSKNIG